MTLPKLLLLVVIVGGLVVFALENTSPVVPLVILGVQTQALPLFVWLVGAIAAGAVTTFLVAGLVQLAVSSNRPRASRFYAERPQYRPRSVRPEPDDDDGGGGWRVMDDGMDRGAATRSSFVQDAERREDLDNEIWSEDEPPQAPPPPSPQASSSFQAVTQAARSKASVMDDWDSFSNRRVNWDDWRAYEEAEPVEQSSRGTRWFERKTTVQAVDTSRFRADSDYSATPREPAPETVIQDVDDRDWQDGKDYREQSAAQPYAEDDREDESTNEASEWTHYAHRAYAPSYSEREYRDDYQDSDRSESMYESYEQPESSRQWRDEEVGHHDEKYRDGVYRDEEYHDEGYGYHSYEDEGYAPSDESSYGDFGDDDAAYNYSSAVDDGDAMPEDAEGYYTDYVRYSEEDDYYDDYDEYANFEEEYEAAQTTIDADANADDVIDIDLEDLEDWEEEGGDRPTSDVTSGSDQPPEPERRIYEVQRPPATVNRSGTIYSYTYRKSEDEVSSAADADAQNDNQPPHNN